MDRQSAGKLGHQEPWEAQRGSVARFVHHLFADNTDWLVDPGRQAEKGHA